jgi:hypothetical protein
VRVRDFIQKLQEFPPDARVILVEELGASELEEDRIKMETMNYIEYPPYWEQHPPFYGWEYPSEYKRKIVTSADVVVIS